MMALLGNGQAVQAEAPALDDAHGFAGGAGHGAVDLRLGHEEALS